MDQIVQRVLRFDQFALDLTRGCLCKGEQRIDLRPKAFDVLRHLAENAGRLVPKQELYETVWPNVIVSDDSLVQCIRELRGKLGDDDHRLIKTVPRRGYLLDAALAPSETQSRGQSALPGVLPYVPVKPAVPTHVLHPCRLRSGALLGWAAVFLCVGFGTLHLLAAGLKQKPSAPVLTVFSENDALRIAAVAGEKQLLLPAFQIRNSAQGVPDSLRRFVGVWISDVGWLNSDRQAMLIVTNVARDGSAEGYFSNGPSLPGSRYQGPAHVYPFTGRVLDGALVHDTGTHENVAAVTTQGRIEYKARPRDGRGVMTVSLEPEWTLIKAERAISKNTLTR